MKIVNVYYIDGANICLRSLYFLVLSYPQGNFLLLVLFCQTNFLLFNLKKMNFLLFKPLYLKMIDTKIY